jgi:hypothetical protein
VVALDGGSTTAFDKLGSNCGMHCSTESDSLPTIASIRDANFSELALSSVYNHSDSSLDPWKKMPVPRSNTNFTLYIHKINFILLTYSFIMDWLISINILVKSLVKFSTETWTWG